VIDRAVLNLIDAVTFTGADFSTQHDGVCRMNPELARRVAQLTLQSLQTGPGSVTVIEAIAWSIFHYSGR
jgi:hypothetical protein